jgi:WD40 repeat protein
LTRVAKRVTVGDTSGDGSKKSSTKTATSKKTTSEAYISRAGSGLCFDFNPNDCTKYIAGTEDGTIHGCATAYSETYLRDYHGHAGPVQRVAWSPFVSEVFISARYVFSFPFATFRLPDYTVCSYKLRTLRETDTFFFISPATTGV